MGSQWVNHIDYILFFYGLSFFALGLSILVLPKKGSKFSLSQILWLLAAYGLLHSVADFYTLLTEVKEETRHHVGLIFTTLSYLFLFEFGRRLYNLSGNKIPWWTILPSLGLCYFFTIFSNDYLSAVNVSIGYFIRFPAGVMAGLGFINYFKLIEKDLSNKKLKRYFYLAAIAMFCWAFFCGIVRIEYNFFPATVINTSTFYQITGVPVQLLRMLFSILTTASVVGIMKIFKIETINKLEEIQRELRHSEKKYRTILQTAPDAIVITDEKNKIIYWNKSAENSFYYTQEEVMNKCLSELISDYENPIQFIHPETGQVGNDIEMVGIRKDGTRFSMELSMSYWSIDDKKFYCSIIRDITGYKIAEKMLQESEEKYRSFIENSHDVIWTMDKAGKITFLNKRAEQLTGSSLREIKDNAFFPFVQEDVEMLNLAFSRTLSGKEQSFTVRILDKNNQLQYLSVLQTPHYLREEIEGVLAFGRNITEERHAAERFNTAIKASADGFCLTDVLSGKILEVNDAYCKMVGYTREEILKMTISDFEALERPQQTGERIMKIIAKGHDRFETQHKVKSGDKIDVEVTINYSHLDKGQLYIFIHDISERKKFERELIASELKFRTVLQTAPDAIILSDEKSHIIYCNNSADTMFDLQEREIYGRPLSLFIEGYPKLSTSGFMDSLVPYGEARISSRPIELKGCRKDGSGFPLELSLSFWTIEENKYFCNIIRDITDRKNAEQKLVQTIQKLKQSNKELEQFAHIASHDLQEPLRTIGSFSQLVQLRYKDKLDQDANEFLQFAVDGAASMKKLIKNLIEFSGISEHENSHINIDSEQLFRQVLKDLQPLISEYNASITFDSLPEINAEPNQIHRLFLNLIQNAVKFSKKDVHPLIHVSCKKLENSYCFAVKDNGIGIKEEYVQKVFTIFQRLNSIKTYPGSGIGLSVCKRIVERHGGNIWAESKINEGSTFYFTLPCN